MGQKTSRVKVVVQASVPAGQCRVDEITLSYTSNSWWRRGRRRVARFTFPCQGWSCQGGEEVCAAREAPRLPLAVLHGKDGSTTVRVKCSWGGARVFVAYVALARLQALMEDAVEGDAALLNFRLAGSDDALALTCNEWWRCCHGDDGEGEAACPGHREGGGGTEATPGLKENDCREEGGAECPSHREGSWGTEASLGQEKNENGKLKVGEAECPSHREGGGGMKEPAMIEGDHQEVPAVGIEASGTDAENDLEASPPKAPVRDTAWGVMMGYPWPSMVTILENTDWLVPEAQMRHPKCRSECCACVPVPEIDLADSSSLVLLRDLHSKEEEVETPTSLGMETVPGSEEEEEASLTYIDAIAPSYNARGYDAVPSRLSRWTETLIDIGMLVAAVTVTVMYFYEMQCHGDTCLTTTEAAPPLPLNMTELWDLFTRPI